ncbi:hypothetical protein SESBI_18544 [Sesbania bispinosa]|nr:hypothetical protein SESBI_18544 [Sesbania bispinosa]
MEPKPEFFLTLILHHGGKFVKDEKDGLEYVACEKYVWEGLDVDTICLWTPSDMCKEHGLRPLAEDLDVRQMCNIGMMRDWKMHIYFEYPIDNPKISKNPPNGAINDEDLCRIMDEIVRMTMEAHCLEYDGSEDSETMHKSAYQINEEETQNDSGIVGIDVNNTTIDIEDFTDVQGAARADNDRCEHLGDGDNEGRKDMDEDDLGNDCSDEDKPYEALEVNSSDDYESTSDSPYRPPLF